MMKRILALLLCFALVVAIPVYAAEIENEEMTPPEGREDPETVIDVAGGTLMESDGVYYRKTLKSDGADNLYIELEVWTEGVVNVVPTEIVFVIDQSGSMYQAADNNEPYDAETNPGGYMTYEQFIEFGDKEKAAKYPGYYMAVAENTRYQENAPAYTAGATLNWNGQYDASHKYAVAMVSYNETDGGWVRCNQVSCGSWQYDDLSVNPVFKAYEKYSDLSWNPLGMTGNAFCRETAKYFKSLYGATVDAYCALLEEVKDIPNCSIAVVGFSSPRTYTEQWVSLGPALGGMNHGGTGLFINGVFKHASQLTTQDYIDAFVKTEDIVDSSMNLVPDNPISMAINNIRTNYNETCTEDGFLLANELFKNSTQTNANRVVVLFTDGAPTANSASEFDYENNTYKNRAADYRDYGIAAAYITKNTYNASVYAFGHSSISTDKILLDYQSSDYPDALKESGTYEKKGDGYSGITTNTDDLKNTFRQIGEKIYEDSTALNKQAVVKDIISPYFQLNTDVNGNGIQVYNVPCTGGTEGAPTFADDNLIDITSQVTVNVDGQTIDVTNYDYAANSVYPSEARGNKLRIIIPIQVKDEFLGGNTVPTNAAGSGIYDSSGALIGEGFEQPSTDVELAPEVVYQDVEFSFLGAQVLDTITIDDLNGIITIYVDNNPLVLDSSRDDWGLGWMADYVTINVELLDKNGNTMPNGFEDIREDLIYQIRVSITPKYDGAYTQEFASAPSVIHVFKPELTFQDAHLCYGEDVPSDWDILSQNTVSMKWKWTNPEDPNESFYSTAADVQVAGTLGEEPGVLYHLAVAWDGATMPKHDIPVDVHVTTIGYITAPDGLDLNEWCTFVWQKCSPDCGYTIPEHNGEADYHEFILHSHMFQLTITKSGGAADEPYVFTIYRDGNPYTEASITGNGSVTICELPVGTYSIQEDKGWSWRYQASYTNPVTLDLENTTGAITCTNSTPTPWWLNGFSDVIVNIFGQSEEGGQ